MPAHVRPCRVLQLALAVVLNITLAVGQSSWRYIDYVDGDGDGDEYCPYDDVDVGQGYHFNVHSSVRESCDHFQVPYLLCRVCFLPDLCSRSPNSG